MFVTTETKPIIYFYSLPVDLRNGCEGLASIALSIFTPTESTCFVFLNRRRTRIKILYWDHDNLSYWFARSRKGVFAPMESKTSLISTEELKQLLNGCFPNRLNVV